MKVEWYIEGIGCHQHRCGAKARITEIPDEDLPDEGPERERFIDDWIAEEFQQKVYFIRNRDGE